MVLIVHIELALLTARFDVYSIYIELLSLFSHLSNNYNFTNKNY